MSLLDVSRLCKRYGSHTALRDVSLSIPAGCIYGLLGPNGAGKTTLIRSVCRLVTPDSGDIRLDGQPVTADTVRAIGYLPEERGLYKKMRLSDHIVYLARLRGMPLREALRETDWWLRRLGLSQWADKRVETLSKGMAQKAQFIATVVHRPRLLILDEPFSGFDPVNAEAVRAEIVRLAGEGATVMLSTHNMTSVEAICSHITLINRAEVVLQGNVAQIRQKRKKNAFSLHIAEGELLPCPTLFAITHAGPHPDGGTAATVTLLPGVSLRQVIDHVNGHYTLCGLHELLPTMNEIFIDTVSPAEKGDPTL